MSKETNTKQILLPVDFPASHSVSQEKEKEQMTIDISGTKLLESLENVNPDGSLAKMLKVLLTSTTGWYSDRCKLIWKKKVSKSNVLLFQLQASVLGIKEKEFGLWATPNTMDVLPPRSKEGTTRQMTTARKGRTKPANLREQVDPSTMEMYGWMLPTPRVSDIEGGAAKNVKMENGHFYRENKKGERWGVKLRDVMEMYPTPRASAAMTEDMETIAKRNKYNSKLEEKVALQMYPTPTQDSVSERTKKYKQGGLPLTMAVKLYPTPTTRDYKDSTVSPSYKNRKKHSIRNSNDETKESWWQTQSRICGVPNGVSFELDKARNNRIKSLGNSIVPQIVRQLGFAILEAEK
jgi:hypothetical protein